MENSGDCFLTPFADFAESHHALIYRFFFPFVSGMCVLWIFSLEKTNLMLGNKKNDTDIIELWVQTLLRISSPEKVAKDAGKM